MKIPLKFSIVFALTFLFLNEVRAESYKIELGWTDIVPCSTVEWRNDGVFGLPSPTVYTSPQRLIAYATIDAASVSGIQNDIQQCAVQGAAAATLAAILASPGSAMPAFQAQFEMCFRDRARNYISLALSTETRCM
jgi:hypothetical protein